MLKSLSKTEAVPLRVLISDEVVVIREGIALLILPGTTVAVKPPAPVIVLTSSVWQMCALVIVVLVRPATTDLTSCPTANLPDQFIKAVALADA